MQPRRQVQTNREELKSSSEESKSSRPVTHERNPQSVSPARTPQNDGRESTKPESKEDQQITLSNAKGSNLSISDKFECVLKMAQKLQADHE